MKAEELFLEDSGVVMASLAVGGTTSKHSSVHHRRDDAGSTGRVAAAVELDRGPDPIAIIGPEP
jgi:hypothetical protein